MLDTAAARENRTQIMLLLLVVVLVFAAPIRLLIPTPGPEFRRALVCGLELLFVVSYLSFLRSQSNFVSVKPLVAFLFLTWTVSAAVSIATSAHWAPSLVRQVEWVTHILFGVTVWHFVRGARFAARWVIILAALGAMAATLIVFSVWYNEPEHAALHWREYLPLFTHIRHFGYYAVIGLLLSHLWISDSRTGRIAVVMATLVLCVFWGAIIWTGGRSAVAAAIVGVVLLGVLSPRRRSLLAGANVVALSVGSFIATFLSSGRSDLGWPAIIRRLDSDGLREFMTGRQEFWRLAFGNFVERPVFGYGPDAYIFMEPKIYGSHPHNVLLQFLTDYGVVGTTLFGVLMLAAVFAGLRLLGRGSDESRPERLVALAVIAAMCAHALLDGTFYHALPLMLIAVALAIALQPEIGSQGAPVRAIVLRLGGVRSLALALSSVMLIYGMVLTSLIADEIPGPEDGRALLVRHFPAATHPVSLESWIRAWSGSDPGTAIDWAHWAHQNSSEAYRFSALEAQLLAKQGLHHAASEHAVLAMNSTRGALRRRVSEEVRPIMDLAESQSGQMLFSAPDE